MRMYSSRVPRRSTFAEYKLCESIAADANTAANNNLTLAERVLVWSIPGTLTTGLCFAIEGTVTAGPFAVGAGIVAVGAVLHTALNCASQAEAEERLAFTVLMARGTLRHVLSHDSRLSVASRGMVPAGEAMPAVPRGLYVGNKGIGFVRVCSTDDAWYARALAIITTTLKPIKKRAAVKHRHAPAPKETTIDQELMSAAAKE